ncbi:MAG: DUF2807 domain-containing protein [Bacteroidia bacterium]|nr:DUF2807 domain-containing protein [Bacteroidia bacterium]
MIAPILYIIGGIIFFALLVSLLGISAAMIAMVPNVHFFSYGPPALSYLSLANGIFILGIPLIFLVLTAGKFLFKYKMNSAVIIGLWSFWAVNLFCLVSIVGSTSKDFKVNTETSTGIINGLHDAETLHIHLKKDAPIRSVINLGDDIEFAGDELRISDFHIDVVKADNNDYEVELVKSSWGNNIVDADQYISDAEYDIEVKNNHVYLPESYVINRGGKWRDQDIRIIFRVPEGKKIAFGENIRSKHISKMEIDPAYSRIINSKRNEWTMGDEGLTNEAARKEKMEEFSDFDKLDISGNFRVYVEQDDNYDIRIVGEESPHYPIEFDKAGGLLEINYPRKRGRDPIKLYIKMPLLESIALENTNDVKILDFEGESMSISNEGRNTDIKVYVEVSNIDIEMEGNMSEIELHGVGEQLKAKLGNHTILDAAQFKTVDAIVSGEHTGEVIVNVSGSFVDQTEHAEKVKNLYDLIREIKEDKTSEIEVDLNDLKDLKKLKNLKKEIEEAVNSEKQ